MDTARYFIRQGGRPLGPFTMDQLRTRDLSSDTLVWSEEQFQWVAAASCAPLKELIKSSDPPARKKHWWPFARRR